MTTPGSSAGGATAVEDIRKAHEQQWPNKTNIKACTRCQKPFTWWKKRCRNCGYVVCTDCSKNNLSLPEKGYPKPVRVCSTCYDTIIGATMRGKNHLITHEMPRIVYAASSRQGAREDNEDRIAISIQHASETWNRDDPANPEFVAFFGVFDGHSGSGTAQYLKEKLPQNIAKHIKQGQLSTHELSRLRSVSQSRRSSLRDQAELKSSLPPMPEDVPSRPRGRSLLNDNLFQDPSAEPAPAPTQTPDDEEEHKCTFSILEPPEESKAREQEGLDLLQIVQYSCLRTDAAYQSEQLKKPNNLRCHSGSCAVFVVFTNAKLKPASKVRRIKEVFYRFSRSSLSNSTTSNSLTTSRPDDSPRSRSSLLSHLSPKRHHGTPSRSEFEPSSLSLNSPGGVLWPFRSSHGDRESKSPNHLSVVCASVGDSEITMHKKGRLACAAKSMFKKHNWEDPEEVRRATAVGAVIKKVQNTKRICLPGTGAAVLAISRAFGDVAFKRGARIGSKKISAFFRASEGSRLKEDQIRAEPDVKDVSGHVVRHELNLLILASDGLWDVFTPEEAVQFVEDELEEHRASRTTKENPKLHRSMSAPDARSQTTQNLESLASPTSEFPAPSPFPMSPQILPNSISTTSLHLLEQSSEEIGATLAFMKNPAEPAAAPAAVATAPVPLAAKSSCVIHRPPRPRTHVEHQGPPQVVNERASNGAESDSSVDPAADFVIVPTPALATSSSPALSAMDHSTSHTTQAAPSTPSRTESSSITPTATLAITTTSPPPRAPLPAPSPQHMKIAESTAVDWLPPPGTTSSSAAASPTSSPLGGPESSMAMPSPLASSSLSPSHAEDPPPLALDSIPMIKQLSEIEVPTLALPRLESASPGPEDFEPTSPVAEDDVLKPLPCEELKEESRSLGHNSAPNKASHRRGSAEDSNEDWIVLKKICDKLADAAVAKMAAKGEEGDNVSVIIIHFPDDKK